MARVEVVSSRAPARPAVPWRAVVVPAAAATLLAVALVLTHVQATGRNPLNLLQAGARGPSAAVVARDFPETPLLEGGGHDGQQFYAIARQPMHWKDVAPALDRPAYRLQRALLPWLAWVLHPGGGGPGLVLALFAVGVAAMFAGGVALGALSASLGGPTRLGALFPLLPGTLVSLRITTSDTLAVALALVALACLVRGRSGWAVVAGVAAVLAKEPAWLILAGFALWRRDRASAVTAGVAAAVAGALALILRGVFPDAGRQVVELVPPLTVLPRTLGEWWGGGERLAMATVAATVALAVVALRRGGLRNPFGGAVALQLALLSALSFDASALNLNATRSVLPLGVCALLALACARRGATEPAAVP